ncbi:helix-turn-helix domain-containing protein [Caballeronia sp. LZ001]|uniref:helix-turn-helix domain-containing protein n=1 Tax=Caballeronia sp. LZ001 TaxID=3038553 RepID=UPI00285F40A0|nr:helix-turn-helix domain-containing protein [Caballeronia sp. LZ001]MDR5805032.1 helix-turn-helix domain-containing protein [Caballeronia sp. LZ001]
MSEPQHPTPFGSHTGGLPVNEHDGQAGTGGAASNASQTGPLDSIAAVGARLAQLRHAKSWSIDDISARLKVSPNKLLALEAGDISQLPDRTFAAGIVRSYAKVLGTDPAPFTQAFRREGAAVGQNLKVPASAGAGLPRQRVSVPLGGSSGKKRSWLWGIAAVVVVLAALVMWHTGGDSSAWLARLKSSTGAGTAAPGDTVSASVVSTPDEAAAANTGEAASLPEVAAAPGEQPMPRPLGTNALPASSSTIAALQGASASAAAKQAPAAGAAASAPVVAGTGASAVELKVKEDSWFSVRGKDGKEVFSGLVHAGSTQRVQGEAPFKVTVGNAKSVDSISFDDQPVDAKKYVSARGNVARFTLP